MTTMVRRFAALLLVPVLLGAACGGGGSDDDGASDESQCPVDLLADATSPVEVTFWHSGLRAGLLDAIKSLTDQYNAEQQKVRVTLQVQGTYEEGRDKYVTALRGGTLPDLMLLEETQVQLMIDSKSVVPVQACIDADDYDLSDHVQPVLDQFRVGDDLWPMPFNLSNPVLYFDANDFTKAGLDPADPPSSFDEMLDAARKIKESGAARHGFAWEMQPWYLEQWFAKAGETIVDNGNGRESRAERTTLNSETGQEIFGFVEKLFAEEGLALNVGRNEAGTDTLLAVGTGDAAMAIGTSAALGSIYEIQDAGQFSEVKLGVAPLPGPNAESGGVQVGGGALWLVGKGKSGLTKAATWDYMKWLNEPEQQALWHKLTGYIPVRKSSVKLADVAELWKTRPAFRVAYDQLASSKADQGGPVIGPYKEFRDAIRQGLESMVLKGLSVKDALALIEREANEALESYNERVGD